MRSDKFLSGNTRLFHNTLQCSHGDFPVHRNHTPLAPLSQNHMTPPPPGNLKTQNMQYPDNVVTRQMR